MASNDFLNAISDLLGEARHLVKYLKSGEGMVEGEDVEELQRITEKCIALCRATSGGDESVITTLDKITERRRSSPNGDAVEQPVNPRNYNLKRLRKSIPSREGGFSNSGADGDSRTVPSAEQCAQPSGDKRHRRRIDVEGYASEYGVTLRVCGNASFGVEKMKLRRRRKNFNPKSSLSKGKNRRHHTSGDD